MKIHKIQRQNQDNHENLNYSTRVHENHEIQEFHARIQKIMKI